MRGKEFPAVRSALCAQFLQACEPSKGAGGNGADLIVVKVSVLQGQEREE